MKAIATLTAASVLAFAGAAAFAQTTPPAPPPAAASPAPTTAPGATPPAADAAPNADRDRDRPTFSRADLDALREARVAAHIAALQAGLKLTPEQQRLFAPVEQAIRAQATERAARMDERRTRMEERRGGDRQQAQANQPRDLMQRLEERAERVKERNDRLQAYVTAMKPFWASLSDDQKRLLPVLMRAGDGERGGRRGHHHGDRMDRRGDDRRDGRMERHGRYDHGDRMGHHGRHDGPR